jgi:CRISPR-associated protein (TIGR03984 family)
MRREIEKQSYSLTPVEVDGVFSDDAADWLAEKARDYKLTTLLAHADDGLIWGRMDGERLISSHDAFPDIAPKLRSLTLQQARLFGPQAELLLWRDREGKWSARLLDDDGTEKQGYYFDEAQLQWGDHQEGKETRGFTLAADGQEGLRHAPPLPAGEIGFGPSGSHPLRLHVRHYLERDEDDGALIIVQSRLVKLVGK